MGDFYVLYNPLCGNGEGEEDAKMLDIALPNAKLFFDMTKITNYAAFLSGISADDYLIVAGGDGTLSRFANDTAGVEILPEILYFPIGTGNDFAREFGKKPYADPFPVTEQLKHLPTVKVKGKTYRFINGVGFGLDGYCCEEGDKLREKSDEKVNYTAIAIKGLLFRFAPRRATVTVDGQRYTYDKVWIAPTMHGKYYGGGMMPAPTEQTLSLLTDMVIQDNYDLGIALDGDGDRLGIIDSNGKYIGANEILCMLYYYLVKYKGWKGPVVRNLATTHMLDKIAESFGEKCYEVPVGFKYISSKIDEVDAVLGGESSGGLTVRGHIHGKDSIYAASLFAEMVCVTGKTPTQIMRALEAQFGKYFMVEDNLHFAPEIKSEIEDIIMVQKKLPDFDVEVERVNYEDGCKVYFKDGSFVICRFSGTEPLLRIFAESSTKKVAAKYITDFREFLEL